MVLLVAVVFVEAMVLRLQFSRNLDLTLSLRDMIGPCLLPPPVVS